MSRFERSLPASYFDDLYAGDRDPWRFETSAYERDKYAETLNALPRGRYSSVLEIGCSIGVLTRQLASRADALVGIDVAQRALDEARRRCRDLDHVRFEMMSVPSQWPTGSFDLIVLSEVVYYLDRDDVVALADRMRGAMRDDGDIVLVHWLGETHYPLTGDEAVDLLTASTAAWTRRVKTDRHDAYRLDVLRAAGAP